MMQAFIPPPFSWPAGLLAALIAVRLLGNDPAADEEEEEEKKRLITCVGVQII